MNDGPIKEKSIRETRENLPVYKSREKLYELIQNHQVVIVEGGTGSGKSTQIPQYLKEWGFAKGKRIGVTQPRRVNCTQLAKRLCVEMQTKLGKRVGYHIKYDNQMSAQTEILFLTDGKISWFKLYFLCRYALDVYAKRYFTCGFFRDYY